VMKLLCVKEMRKNWPFFMSHVATFSLPAEKANAAALL
jgi:hypothetical protein